MLLSSKCTCVCVRMWVWCWGSVCCVSVPAVISWKVGGSEVSARLQSSWTHLTSLTWAAAKLSPQWDTGSTHSVVVLFLCHLYPTFKYICIYYLQYIHSHKYVYTHKYMYINIYTYITLHRNPISVFNKIWMNVQNNNRPCHHQGLLPEFGGRWIWTLNWSYPSSLHPPPPHP